MVDSDQDELAIEDLWKLYDQLLTWRDLSSRHNLLARVKAALPAHQILDHQAAGALRVLITEATSLAERNAKNSGESIGFNFARNCDAARRLAGLVEKPGSTKELRRKDAAIPLAPDSDSTIRRRCGDRTYFRSLLSAIDQALSDATALRSFIQKSGLKRVINQESSATPQDGDGVSIHLSGSQHQDITELLKQSADLRRKLHPQKVARALLRKVLVEQVVEATNIDVSSDSPPRVLALRGDAGIGKTVVTGQVYDLFVNDTKAAVLVVPCEMLLTAPVDVDDLDREFGRVVKSEAGLLSAVQALSAGQPLPVVVLFDTLDYLLSTASRMGLMDLFTRLHDVGVTIVFSCRRHDYNVMLRPEDIRFGRLALHAVPPVDIRPLEDQEVIEITKSYLEYHGIQPRIGEEKFARNVLEMAADRVSLKVIVTNPLLLVMLCDTFAHTHDEVPRDLTTTRLCSRYRETKISSSRRHPGNTALATRKLKLWLEIAGKMWDLSGDHIVLSVPEAAIITDDEQTREAYQDLRSEEVLIAGLDGLRIKFNHQVLAEYSIAIYLRDVAPDELEMLLEGLREEPTGRWYGWQIVRHLMALAEDKSEAERLLAKLDLSQAPAFRAAVFGLVEQWREGLLPRLAQSRESFDDLLEALPAIPDEGLSEALAILGDIIKRGTPDQVGKAAVRAGIFIARAPNHLQDQISGLLDVLSKIATGKLDLPGIAASQADDYLKSLLDVVLDRHIVLPSHVLAATRSLVPHITPKGARIITRTHLVPGVPDDDRQQMLSKLLSYNQAYEVGEEALELSSSVIKWSSNSKSSQFRSCDPRILLTEGGKNSNRLRSTLVANALNQHEELRRAVITDFLNSEDKQIGNRLLICFQEAVKRGGAEWIVAELTEQSIPDKPGGLGRVCGLLKVLASNSLAVRHKMADWFVSHVNPQDSGTVDAYFRLVHDSPERVQFAIEQLVKLSDRQQEAITANLARELKPEQWLTVGSLLTESEATSTTLLRARIAGKAAAVSEDARRVLLDLVNDPSSLASLQALRGIQAAADKQQPWLTPELLVRFANSSRRHVRVGALKALAQLVRNHSGPADDTVATWLTAAHERGVTVSTESPEETATLLDVSHAYIRDGVGRAHNTLDAIGDFVDDVLRLLPSEVPFVKTLLALIKTAAMHPDERFSMRVPAWSLDTLNKLDLAGAGDGRSFAQETLGKLIEREYLQLDTLLEHARNWPFTNVIAVVQVIVTHDPARQGSTRLDEILSWDIDVKVSQAIWKHRLRDLPK